jgi:hypothetical protein
MAIFPTFYVSYVKHIHYKGLEGQDQAADDIGAHHGKLVTHTDDGEDIVKSGFECILDFGKADNGWWQYLVKWIGYDRPTWQPATDLHKYKDDIWKFHYDYAELPRLPSWVSR